MNLEGLSEGAKKKGLRILATGDFTHPKWFSELSTKLEPSDHDGLFSLKGSKPSDPLFILSCEVASIISLGMAVVKKVHHIIFFPTLDAVAQFNDTLSKHSNLAADGRPVLGNTAPAQIADYVFGTDSKAVLIPAHIWTPWFSVLGSKSGYDSIEAGYEDRAKKIFAVESGLSSDPGMNRRISSLDKYAIVSNSDSHSPYPWRLGRECNAFSIDEESLSYDSLFDAIRKRDRSKFAFTVEVDPNYGKYHYDGHRACGVCLSPAQSKKVNGICPVCKRPLTIGVQYRVDELADREPGYLLAGDIPYRTVLPLAELLSAVIGSPLASKKVSEINETIMRAFGSELSILLDASRESLSAVADEKIVAAIMMNRQGKLKFRPGYDGEYGVIENLGASKEKKKPAVPIGISQKSLSDF